MQSNAIIPYATRREAHEEIQRQVEAMEALEGRIAAAGEERGRLLKQIERLVGEKAEVEKMVSSGMLGGSVWKAV